MCLVVDYREKVKIAKKPLLGWKWVMTGSFKNGWYPPYYFYVKPSYKYNIKHRAQGCYNNKYFDIHHLQLEDKLSHYVVNEGFHCFVKPNRIAPAPSISPFHRDKIKLKPCIIPKDSEYVKGLQNQMASTDIIVCRNIFSALSVYLKELFSHV